MSALAQAQHVDNVRCTFALLLWVLLGQILKDSKPVLEPSLEGWLQNDQLGNGIPTRVQFKEQSFVGKGSEMMWGVQGVTSGMHLRRDIGHPGLARGCDSTPDAEAHQQVSWAPAAQVWVCLHT